MSVFYIKHTPKLNSPPLHPPRPPRSLVTEGNERLIQQLIGQFAQKSRSLTHRGQRNLKDTNICIRICLAGKEPYIYYL
jgi:hypothetical protein